MHRHSHGHFGRFDSIRLGGKGAFFGGRSRGGAFGGPFGGMRGGGGPGMRAAKMLASGDLQLIILLLLSQKPRHGYEIIKALEEHSSGIYTPSPGMVYPALTYLEEMGYAAAVSEGTKKLYTITPEGTDHLAKHRDAVTEVWNQLALFGRKLAHFQRQFTEDETVEENFGGAPGDQSRSESKQMKTEFRGLRDELKAALYEKLDSSLEEKKRILRILRQTIDDIRGKS